jgi:CheY-like chemotaxis protein
MCSPVHLKPQSKMLLCIDDNEEMLECEKTLLESFGYTVLTAPSGGKGLELASTHLVDVVIVDYFMPEMNGQEVLSAAWIPKWTGRWRRSELQKHYHYAER